MLQVASYNIGGARKLRQPPHNPVKVGGEAAITLMGELDPEVPTIIGLQETGLIRWQNQQLSVAHQAFAEAFHPQTYYHAHFAEELDSNKHPHARLWTGAPYAGMSHAMEGNGFVTNLHFADWDWPTFGDEKADRWTSAQISSARLYSTGNRNTQLRNAIVASLTHTDYGKLFFMNTHLGTLTGENRHDINDPRTQEGEASRTRQAEQILRMVAELRQAEADHNQAPRPIILVGDFNATPDAVSMQRLQEVFTLLDVDTPEDDRWTHAGHKIWIDHILVSDPRGILPAGRAKIQTELPFDDLSDHRPIVATFGG